jgi:hypothetical protein
MARALLFAPILLTVFLAPTGGTVLWIGVALVAVDQFAELLDPAYLGYLCADVEGQPDPCVKANAFALAERLSTVAAFFRRISFSVLRREGRAVSCAEAATQTGEHSRVGHEMLWNCAPENCWRRATSIRPV